MAQERVLLRTGAHASYSRLVFDWSVPVEYSVQDSAPNALSVTFQKSALLDVGAVDVDDLLYITEVKQSADSPLTVSLKITEGSRHRSFKVGNRIVLDVFAPDGKSGVKKQTRPVHSSSTEVLSDPVPDSVPEKKTLIHHDKAEEKTGIDRAKEALKNLEDTHNSLSVLEAAKPSIEPHVITLSTTESVGVAAFRRFGSLWIILDRPNVHVPPQIAGPTPEIFPPFERSEIKGGVVFRTKMPSGYPLDVYGEGGGLVWRFIVTPTSRDVKSIAPERAFLANKRVRGGTVFWPMQATSSVLEVPDPSVGDILKVVTVEASNQFSGIERDYVDFKALHSAVGIAIEPKIDDLDVVFVGNGVQITRPGGLAMSRTKDVNRRLIREEVLESSIVSLEGEREIRRIFDFDRWMMGGLSAMEANQRILLSEVARKSKMERVQDLLTLAKMNIANDRGQEAIGYLRYAAQEIPGVAEGAEFIALRAAAYTLAAKYELAFRDLRSPLLKDYNELDYWRAYALAGLEDWQQAKLAMPRDFSVLVGYPKVLLEKIGLKLAEVSLRAGHVETTESILAALRREQDTLMPWTTAGMNYLKAEAHRQSGEYDRAKEFWSALAEGSDDLYRAKAGLALTMLELETGDIDRSKAIDRLEGLRYSWRGDEMEAQTNFMLGRLYLEDDRYLKGLAILRDAASMSPDSTIGHDITTYMADIFKELLINDEDMSPLDAVTVYEEFIELTPSGDDGNKVVQKLAERLVEADLLGRAAEILQHQVDYRIKGSEKARVALRVAAIYLLDDHPVESIKSLNIAKALYSRETDSQAKKKLREIELLRARALSQMDRTEEAIELLNGFDPDPDVNRLRADIAWQAALWDDAAEALQDLILDEAFDLNRPLTGQQADLILNRSVALNLSGNRVALANMRKRYGDNMKKTARARLFDVVTRPRKGTMMTDRETISAIVKEVDIFKDFLDSYRSSDSVSN